jgi:hypothetical protein
MGQKINHSRFSWENQKEKGCLEDIGLDGDNIKPEVNEIGWELRIATSGGLV